jgi:hypothetical protein
MVECNDRTRPAHTSGTNILKHRNEAVAQDHLQSLKALRDHLVKDRRDIVASILADPQISSETAGEFVGLQQFIDAVERALSHENVLSRPDAGSPRSVQGRP